MKTALLFLAMVGTLQGQRPQTHSPDTPAQVQLVVPKPVIGSVPQCSINGGKMFPERRDGMCYAEDVNKLVAGSADVTPKRIVGAAPRPEVYAHRVGKRGWQVCLRCPIGYTGSALWHAKTGNVATDAINSVNDAQKGRCLPTPKGAKP